MKTKVLFRKMWLCCVATAWLFPQWSMAEDVYKLVIKKEAGTEVSVLLSEEPVIKFPEPGYYDWVNGVSVWYAFNLMQIETADRKIELSTDDLDKMMVRLEDLESRVINITNGKAVEVKVQDGVVLIEVDGGAAHMAVYSMDGKTILSKSLAGGKHILPLSDLPHGVCMIKINNETIKVWNK